MKDWPEDIVMVCCGLVGTPCGPAPGSTIDVCYDCGKEIWVSPHTIPQLEGHMKEKKEIKGYRFLCRPCVDKRQPQMQKEGIKELTNTQLSWRYN